MATAFDDDKHTGARSTVFDDLNAQTGRTVSPPSQTSAPPPGAVGVASPGGGGGVLQTVDDAVRAAADSATFGLLDRALEYTGAEPNAIQKTLQARERSPYATIAGDVGGMAGTIAATPLRAVGAGLSYAAGGARAGARGLMGRVLGYGAEGAGQGAAQAAGHTYDLESLPENLKSGVLYGGAGGAVGGAITSRAAVAPRPRAAVPTNEELGTLASGDYALARSNPHDVAYSGPATRATAETAKQDLYSRNLYEKRAPSTFEGLDMPAAAERASTRAAPHVTHSPMDIETIRQTINEASTGRDIAASRIAKQYIDDFTANPTFGSLSRGTPAGARATQEIIDTARSNQAAKFRSDIVQKARDRAELGAASRDADVDKPMRAAISRVLATEGRSFNPAETAALNNAATRADRYAPLAAAGKVLSSGSNVVNQALFGAAAGAGAGYYGGGDTSSAIKGAIGGAAVPYAAGRIIRSAGNRATRNAVNEADELIRSRSPEFERRQQITPGYTLGPGASPTGLAVRNEIVNQLLRNQQIQQQRGY